MHWITSRYTVDLASPKVMGIINLTPDSFSDGGLRADLSAAVRHAEALVAEGADILDLGAESTRPGAHPVPADEEWRRLEPVLKAATAFGVPLSVDTRKAEVMKRALDAGADIVNDVAALREAGALDVLAGHPRAGICLMHMQLDPATMQRSPQYGDVVQEVRDFLQQRVEACRAAGIAAERIVVDPGIGFGKTAEHNLELLRRQRELTVLGRPLLVGWSRKSTLGVVTGRPVEQRLAASVTAAVAAIVSGARIVRVHDVAATRDAMAVAASAGLISGAEPPKM
jgi:dihydropteroate synthase